MAADFQVTGADQFVKLSKALKNAGRTDLRRDLNKRLRDAGKPLIAKTREAARSGRLPDSGGLAALVAKEPQRVVVSTGRDPGVKIVVGRKGGGARAANRGEVRHPVFGRSGSFVTQQIEGAGWFDATLADAAPTVLPFLEKALNDVVDRVGREGF